MKSEFVVVWKAIPGIDRLVCFINLNKNGLFWFEVVDNFFIEKSTRFSRKIPVNAYYLDQLIDEYFLKIDFLSTLKPSSIIYRTTSESSQLYESKGYAFMLFNLIESYYISSDLLNLIKKIFESKGISQDELIIHPIWIKSQSQIARQIFISTTRLKDFILSKIKNKVILVLPLINLSTQDKDRLERLIKDRVERIEEQDIPELKIDFLTPESIDNALLSDNTQLEALISTFVEKARKENNLDTTMAEVSIDFRKVNESDLMNEDLLEEESE
ncbi:hypothetical protein [Nostoc sp.]|uniref:hypothetical protein n=1 Tax=Nostoc sp. TaxID=1180 RepID=UPI002FFD4DE1